MASEPSQLWLHPSPLVLASKSPTRRHLLAAAGLNFLVVAPAVDERTLESQLPARETSPAKVAQLLATAKAKAVSYQFRNHWVLGADQVLSLDGQLFHKPTSQQVAREQLQILSGQTHHLHSALSLMFDGVEQAQICDQAALTMRKLSDLFLAAYMAQVSEKSLLSVGGYQLEGLGVHLFERVEGAHTTILGLPMIPLLTFFRRAGVLLT